MKFDTDILKILKRKINVSNRIYFAWLTLFVFFRWLSEEVLLFPNFQRSFGFTSHPVFERECKGKGRSITTKIFSEKFSEILAWFSNCFVKNSIPFLKKGSKDTMRLIHHKVFCHFLFNFSLLNRFTFFEELTVFLKRVANIRVNPLLPKIYWK